VFLKIGGAFPLFWDAKQKINDSFPTGFEPAKAYLTIGGAFPLFWGAKQKINDIFPNGFEPTKAYVVPH
jgi:hypothetical protein